MRTMTTLVAVVGPKAARVLERIDAANVSTEPAGELPADPPAQAEHLAGVWGRAIRRGSVYTLVDADPLGAVVEAWAQRLVGGRDDLELTVGLVPRAPAPDFYLVDPELSDPHLHWYADHLRRLAPARIVLSSPAPKEVLDHLAALPFGPGLPDLPELSATARDYVPTPQLADQPLTTPSGRSLATGLASPADRQASTTSSTSL